MNQDIEEAIAHLKFLKKEVAFLQNLVRETDTGHILTAIQVLNFRISDIRENILKELDL
jgi:hypothetical protein